MSLRSDIKAVSTLMIILLMIMSAIAGGVITYMFTIASYIVMPERTTITITNVYFDKENARSFKFGVLNPSYSPANATITRIALSLKEEAQLYDVIETEPVIQDGIDIPKGVSLNITCFKIRRGGVDVTWGRFAGEFAGKTIIVHVFSSHSPAANIEATLPFVKLHIADTDFDSKASFKRFNITIVNNADSVINSTINEILVPGVELMGVSPKLPQTIANGTYIHFTFNGSWHGLIKTALTLSTEEGYTFSEEVELPKVHTIIQNVIFDEDHTDHFNVTVFNSEESANYVNVTKITGILENGTDIPPQNYPLVGILPNSSFTFKFDWNWKEYRGKSVSLKAYLLQDFETETFTVDATPSPIIVKVLNEKEVFSLQDRTHFNITLQNHPYSLDAVNITKIVVKETGELINNLNDTQLTPGQAQPFHCNISDWAERAGGNLTLTIHAVRNETSEEYTFNFTFTLPVAELIITSDNATICTIIGETSYLNVTVQNLGHSIWNLTISKVIITIQNQTEQLEQTFSKDQIILKAGDNATLLCAFDWKKHIGKNIIVTVATSEGVEALKTFQISESTP